MRLHSQNMGHEYIQILTEMVRSINWLIESSKRRIVIYELPFGLESNDANPER